MQQLRGVARLNVASQRQLGANTVVTGEYVSAHGYEFPLSVDKNPTGAANSDSFDPAAARAAVSIANASLGGPEGTTGFDCATANAATIATYGAYGLGAGMACAGYVFRGPTVHWETSISPNTRR